eukprot:Nk52_evm1s285 gene=Nk52_evmTU1s285
MSLLSDICEGKEPSSFGLIIDRAVHSGKPLLFSTCRSLLTFADRIVVFCFESPPEVVKKNIHCNPKFKNERFIFCDCFTDPLGWSKVDRVAPSSSQGSITLSVEDFQSGSILDCIFAKKLVAKRMLNVQSTGLIKPEKVAVVFDDMSLLLRHLPMSSICRMVNDLKQTKKFDVVSSFARLNGDSFEESNVLVLKHYCSTIINVFKGNRTPTLANTSKEASAGHLSGLWGNVGYFELIHRRKTGKVLKAAGGYGVDLNNGDLHIYSKAEVRVERGIMARAEEPEVDPTANLTFKLNLTEEEKEKKAQVVLPYTHTESTKNQYLNDSGRGGGGKIFYVPDEIDDFDEEDPDEDLDI